VQDGRMWALVTTDEETNQVIAEVLYKGARAKVAQEAVKMTGRLPVFWYECITLMYHRQIKCTPVQVSNIARLSYKGMVELNRLLGDAGERNLDTYVRRLTA
jgi:hypothetical protein